MEPLEITKLLSVTFCVRLMLYHFAASVLNPVTGTWLELIKVLYPDVKVSKDGEFTPTLGKLSRCLHL